MKDEEAKKIDEILQIAKKEEFISPIEESKEKEEIIKKAHTLGLLEEVSMAVFKLSKFGHVVLDQYGGYKNYFLAEEKSKNKMFIMDKKYIIATIISGIVVTAIATFVFTPLGKMLYRNLDLGTKPSIDVYDDKSKEDENHNKSGENINENGDNIYRLAFQQPIELFNENLVVTLNDVIDADNNINLKLTEKKSGFTKIFKKQKPGDVIHFKGYIITLLTVEYTFFTINDKKIKVKVEKKNTK